MIVPEEADMPEEVLGQLAEAAGTEAAVVAAPPVLVVPLRDFDLKS